MTEIVVNSISTFFNEQTDRKHIIFEHVCIKNGRSFSTFFKPHVILPPISVCQFFSFYYFFKLRFQYVNFFVFFLFSFFFFLFVLKEIGL